MSPCRQSRPQTALCRFETSPLLLSAGAEIAVIADFQKPLMLLHSLACVAHLQNQIRQIDMTPPGAVKGVGSGEFGIIFVFPVLRAVLLKGKAVPIAPDQLVIEALALHKTHKDIQMRSRSRGQHSDSYREMPSIMVELSNGLCGGILAVIHEGGYAEAYVRFCRLAISEGLAGKRSVVIDLEIDFFQAQ